MLIAEDLLLLLLDDERGTNKTSWMRPGLGGALLVELALEEKVVLTPKRWWRSGRVEAVPGASAPSDPLLARALATIALKPRSAQDLVNRLGKSLQGELTERLVERGVLEERRARVLGLFPRTTWPTRDTAHEERVRQQVSVALVGGQEPDQRTAAVIALLVALDRAHKTIDRAGVSTRDVKRRAKEIAEGNWAADGVRQAIQAAVAAMSAASAGGAVAATSN